MSIKLLLLKSIEEDHKGRKVADPETKKFAFLHKTFQVRVLSNEEQNCFQQKKDINYGFLDSK